MFKPIFHSVKISNLAEEKEKFFANKKYNPKFIYTEEIDPKIIKKYGLPEEKLFDLSKNIIDKFKFEYGSFDNIAKVEGKLLTQQQIGKAVEEYTVKNNISDLVKPQYTNHMVARTAVSLTNRKRFYLKIRIPVSYREKSIDAVLDHEIGTHIFRMINELRQPWYGHESRGNFLDHIVTEEGLATLHMLMKYPIKLPVIQASYYYAEYLAQEKSFAETFDELGKVIDDQDLVWFLTARVKRGLFDTSEPGGYTKDIVYLKGIIDVAKWLSKNDFDVTNLYHGKIALEDVEKASGLTKNKAKVPIFVGNEAYKKEIEEIISINEFSKV